MALNTDLAALRPGDQVLAEVTRLGNHKRLHLAGGRFSAIRPGDSIVFACADRRAVDQFHGLVRLPDGGADLLARGGIAGEVRSRNDSIAPGTRLAVLGRLLDHLAGIGAAALIVTSDIEAILRLGTPITLEGPRAVPAEALGDP